MKFVVMLCVVLVFVTVISAKKHHKHNNEVSMKKAFKECQKNDATRVDKQALRKFKKNELDNIPQNYGEHVLCLYKAMGLISDDGTINQDNLKKKIAKKAQADQSADVLLQACGSTNADPKQTALNLDACLTKNHI